MKSFRFVLITAFLIIIASTSQAQISSGGTPLSFERLALSEIPDVALPVIDIAALLAEDADEEKLGLPFRFGYPHPVNYDLHNSGIWEELNDGGRLWRLQISCPGAYSINLLYDQFWLPLGATMFVYSADRQTVRGAFTDANNKPYGTFSTAPVPGETCVVEYYEPPGVEQSGVVSLETVVHAYKNIFGNKDLTGRGFGSSGSCNNNVNCPEGADWQDQKRSVAMILTGGGARICSGSLVNNVREDLTPYFLTAQHCLGGEASWIFMFNYESPTCDNIDGPTNMTVSGSTLLANYSYSDFALLELSTSPPDEYDVYYSGWSTVNSASPWVVGIHHPSGDIKKISFEDNPVVSTNYLTNSGDSHWKVTQWDDGTTEGGSSGSPLYDNNHRVVGQLHGGYASCTSLTPDWYGKFAKSWDYGSSSSTRLRDWLDPDNTAATTMDGVDASLVSFTSDITWGWVPFTVNFTGASRATVTNWTWDFGDGDSAFIQSPSHEYSEAGMFDVKLEVTTDEEDHPFRLRTNYIAALADSMIGGTAEEYPGVQVVVPIYARNNVPVNYFKIPFEYSGDLELAFDSFSTVGLRTEYFEDQTLMHIDPGNKRYTIRLQASAIGTSPQLDPGSGNIVNLYFTIDTYADPNVTTPIQLDGYNQYLPMFYGSVLDYEPRLVNGSVTSADCCLVRGDVNRSGSIDISDITYMVSYFFDIGNPPPVCSTEGDIDASGNLDITDLTYLIDYMFHQGSPPPPC